MMLMFRRDHSNERPLDPPTPNVVKLGAPEPEAPESPRLNTLPIRDHETLMIEAALRVTPLQAYWLALTWGPAYAASWSAWVKARHQREFLLYLEEQDR